jgi:hypothetical protein
VTERSRVYHDAHGVRRTLIADDERPDRFVVRTQQDVEPVLASVERDRAIMAHDGVNKLLARIPVSIFERSVHEQWDDGDWKKWLNSSEAAPFRVWPGRV